MKAILVEGGIGVGKTTLVEGLRKALPEFEFGPEPVDIWTGRRAHQDATYDYLGSYNRRPTSEGFLRVQMAIYGTLNERDQTLLAAGNDIVLERTPFSALTFLEADTTSTEQDKMAVRCMVGSAGNYPPITHAVLLDCPAETAAERIQNRGRPSEDALPISYLRQLRQAYLDAFEADFRPLSVVNKWQVDVAKKQPSDVVQFVKRLVLE